MSCWTKANSALCRTKTQKSKKCGKKNQIQVWYKRALTDTGLSYIWSNCNLFGFIHWCIGMTKQAQKGPWIWGAPETLCLEVQNPKGEDRVNGQGRPQNSNFSHPHFHILVLQPVNFNESTKILVLQSILPKNQITSDKTDLRADTEVCVCFWDVAVPG